MTYTGVRPSPLFCTLCISYFIRNPKHPVQPCPTIMHWVKDLVWLLIHPVPMPLSLSLNTPCHPNIRMLRYRFDLPFLHHPPKFNTDSSATSRILFTLQQFLLLLLFFYFLVCTMVSWSQPSWHLGLDKSSLLGGCVSSVPGLHLPNVCGTLPQCGKSVSRYCQILSLEDKITTVENHWSTYTL